MTALPIISCSHRGQTGNNGSVARCALLSDAIGDLHHVSAGFCILCQKETNVPQSPQPGDQGLLVDCLLGSLATMLRSPATDPQFTAAFKQSRADAIGRARRYGMEDSQIDDLSRAALRAGAIRGEVLAAAEANGVQVRLPRVNRATVNRKRERRVAEHRKTRAVPGGVESWRTSHPCVHIDLDHPKNSNKDCIRYPCAVHGQCTQRRLAPCEKLLKSCVTCKQYVEWISPIELRELKIPVLVTTCPLIRDGVVAGHRDTLPKTLQSIVDAGWTQGDVTVSAEPESIVPEGWRTTTNETRLGPRSNLLSGLRHLHREHPDADAYLCVEDDTFLARGVRDEINRRGIPSGVGLIRVFRIKRCGKSFSSNDLTENNRSDFYQYVTRGWFLWGSNAVLITREMVERILADDALPMEHETSPDFWLGGLVHRYKLREMCCNPSLAQTDVDKPSSIRPKNRLSISYSSDTFIPNVAALPKYAPPAPPPPTPLPEQTTVFLISYNRLTHLKSLADQCAKLSGADVRIVDNCSTWPPLVEWLRDCPYQVIRSPENRGKKVIWELSLDQQATERYVVSDPDLDIGGIPLDLLGVLWDGLDRYPWANASGLSLEIDDLPASPLKGKVLAWESKFWRDPLSPSWFRALVDTTFAMRRRGEPPSYGNAPSVRANRPYTARHLPWYVTMEEWTDEDRYYYANCTALGSGSLTRKHVLPLLQGVGV